MIVGEVIAIPSGILGLLFVGTFLAGILAGIGLSRIVFGRK